MYIYCVFLTSCRVGGWSGVCIYRMANFFFFCFSFFLLFFFSFCVSFFSWSEGSNARVNECGLHLMVPPEAVEVLPIQKYIDFQWNSYQKATILSARAGRERPGWRKVSIFNWKSFKKVTILSARAGREQPGWRKVSILFEIPFKK